MKSGCSNNMMNKLLFVYIFIMFLNILAPNFFLFLGKYNKTINVALHLNTILSFARKIFLVAQKIQKVMIQFLMWLFSQDEIKYFGCFSFVHNKHKHSHCLRFNLLLLFSTFIVFFNDIFGQTIMKKKYFGYHYKYHQ